MYYRIVNLEDNTYFICDYWEGVEAFGKDRMDNMIDGTDHAYIAVEI